MLCLLKLDWFLNFKLLSDGQIDFTVDRLIRRILSNSNNDTSTENMWQKVLDINTELLSIAYLYTYITINIIISYPPKLELRTRTEAQKKNPFSNLIKYPNHNLNC